MSIKREWMKSGEIMYCARIPLEDKNFSFLVRFWEGVFIIFYRMPTEKNGNNEKGRNE